MELVIVGSGTAVPHPERVCAAHYIAAADTRILLDCGPGAVHHMARFRLPWQRLTHLFVSHFHNDHVGDIPALFFGLKHGLDQRRVDPLVVIGPPGTRELFERMAAAFGDHLRDPGFEIGIREPAHGETIALGDGVRMTVHPTAHTDASIACRIEDRSGSIGYTGDTGPSQELGAFMRGVDVLLTECSLPDDAAMPGHLTPRGAARLAVAAEPGQLLLTHLYPPAERLDVPALVREAGWSGPVRVVSDGYRVVL